MEFSSKEDLDAPIADVFAAISDFGSFERSAIRRGIEVQSQDHPQTPEVGQFWDVRFDFRGKPRDLHLTLTAYEPSTLVGLSGESAALKGEGRIELLALSPQRTRISVSMQIQAKGLTGRLLLQSFKLAKSKINRRFKLRVAEFAKLTEERLSHSA
ncbi:hypothetical protein RSK20926_04842 [Roseobacter sp. SK209-2-6]|uniref:SRPBCC family protein n=1 Tax=Roseobacter sp. SK209-2-6 TaxID=388739 RepID=UPI0000F3CE8C|nr:SRPBCC family protein [Roseobacter sp. SK209-2-6]EBA15910.1 hypothetical protein RSK20926_04842 [Roseobacter sp. SK209-2-6]